MRESLVHGNMGHHVLVVSDAVTVSEVSGRPLSEGSVAHARRAEVKHSDGGNSTLLQVNCSQGRHSSTCGSINKNKAYYNMKKEL